MRFAQIGKAEHFLIVGNRQDTRHDRGGDAGLRRFIKEAVVIIIGKNYINKLFIDTI